MCAAVLVQEYAIYAKHSGMPEIKTVLGGFVMRRFLGAWTLLTKSLGLVIIPVCLSLSCAKPLTLALGLGSSLGHVAGQGRSPCSRCLLLRQHLHQAFPKHQ